MKSRGLPRSLLLASRLLGIAGFGVLLGGITLSVHRHLSNKAAERSLIHEIQLANDGQTSAVPSTVPPAADEFMAHQVAADKPRYLFIPSLSVKAVVKQVGLTANNHISAPANIHHAGWFTGSAKPGQPGAAVMGGHLSNWEMPGVFSSLHTLRVGDQIIVERGDGQRLTYAVTKSQQYDAAHVDMAAVLAPVDSSKQGLNLITCAGSVIKGTNDFDKRLVVFAERLSNL